MPGAPGKRTLSATQTPYPGGQGACLDKLYDRITPKLQTCHCAGFLIHALIGVRLAPEEGASSRRDVVVAG